MFFFLPMPCSLFMAFLIVPLREYYPAEVKPPQIYSGVSFSYFENDFLYGLRLHA